MTQLATDYIKNFLNHRLVTDIANDLRINSMKVPARHMGITRSEMPQIAGKDLQDFEGYLITQGITLRKRIVNTNTLCLTQMEFNKLKVIKIMRAISAGKFMDPVIVSKDGFVLDGSHRFLAIHNSREHAEIKVLRASVGIRELLDAARSFPKATFRSYSDNKVVPK